jgi:hypothetical protein
MISMTVRVGRMPMALVGPGGQSAQTSLEQEK